MHEHILERKPKSPIETARLQKAEVFGKLVSGKLHLITVSSFSITILRKNFTIVFNHLFLIIDD